MGYSFLAASEYVTELLHVYLCLNVLFSIPCLTALLPMSILIAAKGGLAAWAAKRLFKQSLTRNVVDADHNI
jgi:hypothetical protein